jgi:hypothetical protein
MVGNKMIFPEKIMDRYIQSSGFSISTLIAVSTVMIQATEKA